MFSVLDAKSFAHVDQPQPESARPAVRHAPSQAVKVRSFILGKHFRSRTGCSNCKRIKKKCDEKPAGCSYCTSKGLSCTYPAPKTAGVVAKRAKPKPGPAASPKIEQIFAPLDEMGLDSEPLDIAAAGDADVLIPLAPSGTFNLYLDESGLRLLDYFEKKVSRMICVDPNNSNYLFKTFFTISYTEESISHALAAWGGIFFKEEGRNDSSVQFHLNKSLSLIKNYTPSDKFDQYTLFSLYLIIVGIEICAGDVQNWYLIFSRCHKLLRKMGGVKQVLEDFSYSNEIKWLISNFEYHDILCSNSFVRGTHISTEDYSYLNYYNYGVDPFQGCTQSVFLMLGEVMNEKVKLDLLKSEANLMVVDENVKYFQTVNKSFHTLFSKIESCKPVESELKYLATTDIQSHINLYKLYKVICKLVVLIYIKRVQPSSIDIQFYYYKAINLIEQLVEANFHASLTFAVFITGVITIGENRDIVRDIIKRVSKDYTVRNVIRAMELLEIIWDRNNNGDTFIDWVDICLEMNWSLSLC